MPWSGEPIEHARQYNYLSVVLNSPTWAELAGSGSCAEHCD